MVEICLLMQETQRWVSSILGREDPGRNGNSLSMLAWEIPWTWAWSLIHEVVENQTRQHTEDITQYLSLYEVTVTLHLVSNDEMEELAKWWRMRDSSLCNRELRQEETSEMFISEGGKVKPYSNVDWVLLWACEEKMWGSEKSVMWHRV